ncbi:MAG: hypothetical protein FalmKO_01210 [Falsiruegeria mediterranea]
MLMARVLSKFAIGGTLAGIKSREKPETQILHDSPQIADPAVKAQQMLANAPNTSKTALRGALSKLNATLFHK